MSNISNYVSMVSVGSKSTSKFGEEVIQKNIIKTETKNFFAGMNIKYIKQLHRLYDDLPILPEKISNV